jgi:hypothetical protein
MAIAGKTYQYRLTEAECQLHNLLRRLEAELEDEYPKIFDGTDLSKLYVVLRFDFHVILLTMRSETSH